MVAAGAISLGQGLKQPRVTSKHDPDSPPLAFFFFPSLLGFGLVWFLR